jgi:hypothetical protein
MFTPELSLSALRFMYKEYGDMIWGKYGFTDAYNIDRNWRASDVIGIDLGALILGIENARSGLIWDYFMRNKCAKRALEKIGFKPGTKTLTPLERPTVKARRASSEIKIDGDLSEWDEAQIIHLEPRKHLEFGNITDYASDLLADFMFIWDDKCLYAAFRVTDNEILTPYRESMIYRNDAIELFIDPEDSSFIWGNPFDFQIGLTPSGPEGEPQTWAWFQNTDGKEQIEIAAVETEDGYIIEVAVKWSFLGVEPKEGLSIGISPAVHDLDNKDNSPNAKLTWYFIHKQGESLLGELKLISGKK